MSDVYVTKILFVAINLLIVNNTESNEIKHKIFLGSFSKKR